VAGLLRRSRLSPALTPAHGRTPPPPPSPPPSAPSAPAPISDATPSAADSVVRFGDVAIDPARRTVSRGGLPVAMTHREFELLAFLCASRSRVFSRDELMRKVWGLPHGGQGRTVDNFVAQLRAKLEADPDSPKHLLTVRGSGYRFVP